MGPKEADLEECRDKWGLGDRVDRQVLREWVRVPVAVPLRVGLNPQGAEVRPLEAAPQDAAKRNPPRSPIRRGGLDMLISLHLPKTGGVSFRRALEKVFGNRLRIDYGDLPINTPVLKRRCLALLKCAWNPLLFATARKIDCIHGHFLPLKYRLLRDAAFITWLRDPVERVASHYYFWKRSYDPKNLPSLHKKMLRENWSLERFCLGPEVRNFYSQFLWGFPVERFDFIGITEHYEEDFDFFFRKYFKTAMPMARENVNEERREGSYFPDGDLRRKIEAYHEKDMRVYRLALQRRKERVTVA